MLIFWRIRYLDRNDRQFRNRDLFVETSMLPPAKRAAVELLAESKGNRNEREFLKFRSLFREESWTEWGEARLNAAGEMRLFSLNDYYEDETGKEITLAEMGPILTGSPTAVLVPSGAKQHDLDYMFAEKQPVPVAEVLLSPEEIRLLGYFVRDLHELQDSALMKDGAGSISSGGTLPVFPNGDYHFATAVTDDEIRSFVTIFRRLYMTGDNDPANFLKTVQRAEETWGDHPLAKWVRAVAGEYEAHLKATPKFCQMRDDMAVTFTVKRLIDVFIYTQYAHQPCDKRQRQFTECLQQVSGRRNFLTWLFLNEVWTCGLKIRSAGRVIAGWFNSYCDHHGITPDVLNSLRHEHPGLGIAEKAEDRKTRLFREKSEELAMELWKQHGRPEGGPTQFLQMARHQLGTELLGDDAPYQ